MPENYVEDEYEKEAVKLISKLKINNLRERVSILEQAAGLFEKSANPESHLIINFLLGLSKKIQGVAEKDSVKAVQFLDEALAYYDKVNIDGNNKEYHETKIIKYKRETEIDKKNHSKMAEIFYKIADENLALGYTEEHHINKGMHYLFSGLDILNKDPYAALKELNESIEEFSKTSKKEIIAKLNVVKLRVLSNFQPNFKARLEILNKTLEEIQKTDDKFGFYECRAEINYLKALMERDWKKKIKLFATAGKDFKREGNLSLYNNSLGAINFWRIHDPSLGIEKAIKLLTDSIHYYELAGNKIDSEKATGSLFMLKSIYEGIIKKDDAGFTKNLVEANKHFAKSLPSKELNLTAGLVLFLESLKFKPEKAKDILKKAAEILKIINDQFYHLIYYQYYLIEASLANEDIEAIIRYQQEALLHLEAWLDYENNVKKNKVKQIARMAT